MSEMVGRVARAIQRYQGSPGVPWDAYIPMARVAIQAMREPTDEQRNIYYELSHRTETMSDAAWERAIDAAMVSSDHRG